MFSTDVGVFSRTCSNENLKHRQSCARAEKQNREWQKGKVVGRKKKGGALLRLVIKAEAVRLRKAFAPLAKPMQDLRRKQSRRRVDHLADTDL